MRRPRWVLLSRQPFTSFVRLLGPVVDNGRSYILGAETPPAVLLLYVYGPFTAFRIREIKLWVRFSRYLIWQDFRRLF